MKKVDGTKMNQFLKNKGAKRGGSEGPNCFLHELIGPPLRNFTSIFAHFLAALKLRMKQR
jgi:hypothetical protein